MHPITQTATPLIEAIERGDAVGITTTGEWYTKGIVTRIVDLIRHVFFGYDEALENARNLATFISTPVTISSDSFHGITQSASFDPAAIAPLVSAVKATIQRQANTNEASIHHLETEREKIQATDAQAPLQTPVVELNKKIFSSEHWAHRHALATLDRAILAQQYLGIDQNDINQTPAKPEDVQWLSDELATWQRQQFPFVDYIKGEKHEQIREKIVQCCRYTTFIEKARLNRALLDSCFQTVFKSMPDDCVSAVDIFLQAPQLQEQLKRTYLDKRIRDLANHGIRVQQRVSGTSEGKPIKDISLLIDGEHQSIVDGSAMVRIATGVTTTVSRIFDEFEAQNHRFITMEYLQDKGVSLFDGRLLQVDLEKKEWWKDLPVIRRMTKEEIEKTYNISMKDAHALFVIKASRTTPDLSVEGNHGWSNIIFPLDDGTFNVIAPGKFSDWFPVGLWQSFYHIFRTHRGYVTLLDTNEFMSSRDRIGVPLPPLSKEGFERVMEHLRQELLKSRKGELVFQAQGDNCASWVRKFAQTMWPDLNVEPYATRIQDLSLPSLLMPIIWSEKFFPNETAWQEFRRGFCSVFGATESHQSSDGSNVQLTSNPDWYRGILQVPSRLWLERNSLLHQTQGSPSPLLS